MRVVPLENEDVNECWIADRDRFSYEAVNGESRLTQPMVKQGGAPAGGGLEYGAGLRRRRSEAGEDRIWRDRGWSRHRRHRSCVVDLEELHLLSKLCVAWAARASTPYPPCRFRQRRSGGSFALARHLGRLAVEARPRLRRRLLPAQGSPAAGAASAPGRAPRREADELAGRARRLGDAGVRDADRRARGLAGAAGRRGRRGGQGARRAGAAAGRPRRGRAVRGRRAAFGRSQGDPAGQRCGAARAGVAAAGTGPLDRRTHRRQRRLSRRRPATAWARNPSAPCRVPAA